jgi:hypothetical protein
MLATGVAMAKKRKPGRPKAEEKREPILTIKGLAEFKEWLAEFADHCGLSQVDTIGQALIAYAKEREFRPPPKR